MSIESSEQLRNSSPLASLRRLVPRRDAVERCGMCAAIVPAAHSHLLEMPQRRIACACEACAILFSRRSATRYRRIPRSRQLLLDFVLPDELWESLNLPIGLAFFVRQSADDRTVALYPSPAGAMESLLPLEAWQDIADQNPVVAQFEADVEALLVNRLMRRKECWRVGIDKCYELVGLVRSNWHGLSGGAQVWQSVSQFFDELKGRLYA